MPRETAEKMANGTLISPSYDLTAAKVDAINSVPGELEHYDCKACLNRGYVARRDGDSITTAACGCMAERRFRRRIADSGLSHLLEKCTFDRYTTSEPWQQRANDMAQQYVANAASGWFCALGSVGAGKTHLCVAICNALLSTREIRWMQWRDDSNHLKSVINEPDQYGAMINKLKSVSVLYIDDLFKGKSPTKADINLAYEILNHRYAGNKSTIISSELTMAELLDVDEGVGSRIYERSKGYVVEFSGQKNQRLR